MLPNQGTRVAYLAIHANELRPPSIHGSVSALCPGVACSVTHAHSVPLEGSPGLLFC